MISRSSVLYRFVLAAAALLLPTAGQAQALNVGVLWESNSGTQQDASFSAVGDVDGDGVLDFLDNGLFGDRDVVRSGADGSLLHQYPSSDRSTFVLVQGLLGDVNDDGRDDVAIYGVSSSQVSLRVYSGASLGTALWTHVGGYLLLGVAGDVDGDGVNDLLLHQATGALLHVRSGRNGSLLREIPAGSDDYAEETGPPLLGDIDGDDRGDYLVRRNVAPPGDPRVFEIEAISGIDGTKLYTLSPLGHVAELSTVSDIDGDGIRDVAIGGGTSAQQPRVTVHSGADGSVLWSVETGLESFRRIPPVFPGSLNTVTIAEIGDIDGDGIPELAFGYQHGKHASQASSSGTVTGIVDVVSGADGSWLFSAGADWIYNLHQPTASSRIGTAVLGVGDMNGDGVNDLIVHDYLHQLTRGLDSAELLRWTVDTDGDRLVDPREAEIATDPLDPDSDADGLEDGDEEETADGSGCPDPLDPDSDADGLLDGDEVAIGTGPCNPDSDGDGVPDGSDAFPHFPGPPDPPGRVHAELVPPIPDRGRWTPEGGVDLVADRDGDGLRDVVIGYTGLRGYAGPSFQISSSATGAVLFDGPANRDSGYGVLGLDDTNGDGVADFLVAGEHACDVRSGANPSEVLVALPGTDSNNPSVLHALRVGDVDADGREDFAVRTGSSWVIRSGAEPDRVLFGIPGSSGELVGLGDVNGDGYGDLARSAPQQDGIVHIHSGEDGSLLTSIPGPVQGEFKNFGRTLAGPGDTNADGVPEVLAGENYLFTEPTRARLFSGDGSELASFVLPFLDPFSFSTLDVYATGDVDGDGHADFALANVRSWDFLRRFQVAGRLQVFSGRDGSVLFGVAGSANSAEMGQFAKPVGDFDGDGLDDLLVASSFRVVIVGVLDIDSDGDGLSDAREAELGTDPANPDTDGDGLSDGDEVDVHGTDPTKADTDGDGLDDKAELGFGFDPNDASDAGGDADDDGLTNAAEIGLGTDPRDADSDDDGVADGAEVGHGSDPLDPADFCVDATGKAKGGGEIQSDVGFARFGFSAKRKQDGDPVKGKLQYEDEDSGLEVEGDPDALLECEPDGRVVLSGPCEFERDGEDGACRFRVIAEDRGKPGRGVDRFAIDVDVDGESVESRDELLDHGDIKLKE